MLKVSFMKIIINNEFSKEIKLQKSKRDKLIAELGGLIRSMEKVYSLNIIQIY